MANQEGENIKNGECLGEGEGQRHNILGWNDEECQGEGEGPHQNLFRGNHEGPRGGPEEEEEEETTFAFPILDVTKNITM